MTRWIDAAFVRGGTSKGVFFRADASEHPAAGKDDEAATGTIKSVYAEGLKNLKALLDK